MHSSQPVSAIPVAVDTSMVLLVPASSAVPQFEEIGVQSVFDVALFDVSASVVRFLRLNRSFGANWIVPICTLPIVSNVVINAVTVSVFRMLKYFEFENVLLVLLAATVFARTFRYSVILSYLKKIGHGSINSHAL
jgi:hypothetical protein